jgi:hypothetical protein
MFFCQDGLATCGAVCPRSNESRVMICNTKDDIFQMMGDH